VTELQNTKIAFVNHESKELRKDLFRLQNIFLRMFSGTDIKILVKEIINEIKADLNFPVIAIEMFNETKASMEIKFLSDEKNRKLNNSFFNIENSLSGLVYKSGHIVLEFDVPLNKKNLVYPDIFKADTLKSYIGIPMIFSNKVQGVLSLYSDTFQNISITKLYTLSLIATNLAVLFHKEKISEKIEREKKFTSTILNTMGAFLVVLDREAKIVNINKAFEDLTGYAISEIKGKNFFDIFILPEELNNARQIFESLIRFEPNTYKNYILDKKRNKHLISWKSTFLKDVTGNLEFVIATGIDLTDLNKVQTQFRKKEKELEKQRKLLKAIVENIDEGIIMVDRNGKIIFVNSEACKLLNFEREDILDKFILDILKIRSEKSGEVLDYFLFEKFEDSISERFRLLTDKRDYIVEFSIIPIVDEEGKVFNSVIRFKDITKSVKETDELVDNRKLETLSLLAGGMAHDFNNILAAILNNISFAKLSVSESCEAYSALIDAEQAIIKAKTLTTQLMTLSRMGEPKLEIVDLYKIFEDNLNMVLKGSKVNCKIITNGTDFFSKADGAQIGQVIYNIILNAIQAMKNKGNLRIIFKKEQVEDLNELNLKQGIYNVVSIRDSGPGIKKEHINRIFEPYFTTKKNGTGFGLVTSYTIIKRHKGAIKVETEKGKFAEFSVYLPEYKK